jgi:hypothetical protein
MTFCVLGHPVGTDSDSFLYPHVEFAPDLHKIGFRCWFHFSPTVHTKPEKKCETQKIEEIAKVCELVKVL